MVLIKYKATKRPKTDATIANQTLEPDKEIANMGDNMEKNRNEGNAQIMQTEESGNGKDQPNTQNDSPIAPTPKTVRIVPRHLPSANVGAIALKPTAPRPLNNGRVPLIGASRAQRSS